MLTADLVKDLGDKPGHSSFALPSDVLSTTIVSATHVSIVSNAPKPSHGKRFQKPGAQSIDAFSASAELLTSLMVVVWESLKSCCRSLVSRRYRFSLLLLSSIVSSMKKRERSAMRRGRKGSFSC
jgi:hypothetical protein